MDKETLKTKADQVLDLKDAFELAATITRNPGAAALLLIAIQIAGLEDGLMKLRNVLSKQD